MSYAAGLGYFHLKGNRELYVIFIACHFYYKLEKMSTETNTGSDIKPDISRTITGTTHITRAGEHIEIREFKLSSISEVACGAIRIKNPKLI